MTKNMPMTPDEEYDYYAQPDNQEPQGPARRRQPRLSEMVPVRFTPELLGQIRRRAEADDRSVSSWIRRPAEHELGNSASSTVRNRIPLRTLVVEVSGCI